MSDGSNQVYSLASTTPWQATYETAEKGHTAMMIQPDPSLPPAECRSFFSLFDLGIHGSKFLESITSAVVWTQEPTCGPGCTVVYDNPSTHMQKQLKRQLPKGTEVTFIDNAECVPENGDRVT